MKICIITRAKFADVGSLHSTIYKPAKYYSKCGHDVYIINTSWDKNYELYYKQWANITPFIYPIIKKPFLLKCMSNVFVSEHAIRKLNPIYNFDVVHAHENGQCITHDIVTSHGCHKGWLDMSNNMFKNSTNKLKYVLYKTIRELRPINRWMLEIEKKGFQKGNYKKIIAISSTIKDQIINHYGVLDEDVVVIPNGVDIDKFNSNKSLRETIRNIYKFDENEYVILFSGNDFQRKGLEYVINALPKVREGKLMILGAGDPEIYKKLALKLGVLDRVIFAGYRSNINEYYAASDLFVFPTLYDSFGMVVTEAMASNLPVITSKLGGAADLITDKYDGLLLNDPTNSDEIAEIINLLISDDRIRKRMGRTARKTAEKYSWAEVSKRNLEVYEEVLGF